MGFTNLNLDLRDIILGYKTTHGKYNLVNFILIVMTFTIYKGWCIDKTKKINYLALFKYELTWRFNVYQLMSEKKLEQHVELFADNPRHQKGNSGNS